MAAQIGDLYERRWEGEVDIRSIKSVMQMDILRCKTPEMVRKEIWAHLLAYNLLRTVMAVAAGENGLEPRQVSFKGAKQAVTAFAPKLEAARPKARPALIDAMLAVIAYHRVGDRPGRWEPRARKRRPKPGARLTNREPRPNCRRIARNGSKASAMRPTLVLKLVPCVRRHRRWRQGGSPMLRSIRPTACATPSAICSEE